MMNLWKDNKNPDNTSALSKRKRHVLIRNLSLVLALTVGVTALQNAARRVRSERDISSESVRQEVISKTLSRGVLETYLNSYGTIASADESEITLPGSIRVSRYFVKAGDSVEHGAPIAELDRDSVTTSIAEIEKTVSSLDSRMAQVIEDALAEEITASLAGRVVRIYAQKGESVTDIMYEHGALMLVSLDGLLAVDIPNTGDLRVGDEVLVMKTGKTRVEGQTADSSSDDTALKSSTEKLLSGTVAAVKKDSLTVTFSMDEFSYEDEVVVYAENSDNKDGSAGMEDSGLSESGKLGQGYLYIYSEQKITGYSGTVSAISVSENSSIKAGKTLLTLTDTDYTAEYFSLLSKRDELVRQYNTLINLSEDGILYAKHDGIVTAVDVDLLIETADTEKTALEAATQKSESSLQAAAMPQVTCTPVSIKNYTGNSTANPLSAITALHTSEIQNEIATQGTILLADNSHTQDESEETKPEEEKEEGAEEAGEKPEEKTEKTVKIVWTDANGNDLAADDSAIRVESVDITLIADGEEYDTVCVSAQDNWTYTWSELSINNGSLPISYTVSCDVPNGFTASWRLKGDTMMISFAISEAVAENPGEEDIKPEETTKPEEGTESGEKTKPGEETKPDEEEKNSQNPSEEDSGRPEGSDRPGGNMENGIGTNANGGNTTSHTGSGTKPSGSFGAFFGIGTGNSGSNSGGTLGLAVNGGDLGNGSGDAQGVVSASKDSYSIQSTTLGSMIAADQVCIEMVIDELDINKIAVSDEAKITLDALSGQSFRGIISSIDTSGSNSGGNTKYTATLTMDKTENMYLGMNAAIKLPVKTKEDILFLPAEALDEKQGKTYVYLGYDAKKDQLTDPVEVVTGLSDGEAVEIVEGLEEGQTFYYRYADSISYTFSR